MDQENENYHEQDKEFLKQEKDQRERELSQVQMMKKKIEKEVEEERRELNKLKNVIYLFHPCDNNHYKLNKRREREKERIRKTNLFSRLYACFFFFERRSLAPESRES